MGSNLLSSNAEVIQIKLNYEKMQLIQILDSKPMSAVLPVVFEGGHRVGNASKISKVPHLDDAVVATGDNEGVRGVPVWESRRRQVSKWSALRIRILNILLGSGYPGSYQYRYLANKKNEIFPMTLKISRQLL